MTSSRPEARDGAADRRLTILVVDDNEANLLLLERFLTRQGHKPILAHNGKEAVELFQSQGPDMVLMDIMMPVMDGYEATKRIRELAGDRWTPVIMISAKSQDCDQAIGLEVGADDYLTKPINFTILAAKIKVMQRIANIQQQLARYREEAEEEQRMANTLMKRLIRVDGLADRQLRYWISPARRFSGDLVAATRSVSDELYVILADATGHGLPAALNLLPITQIFYGMAEKGYRVSHIAAELNRRLGEIMPGDRFVAASLICVNQREQTIEIWNGGTPSPVFIDDDGENIQLFPSRHLPLGILPPQEFDSRTDIHHWESQGEIFMFSDGLLDAEGPAGAPFGMNRLLDIVRATPPRQRFISVAAAIQEHLGGAHAHDDLTLVSVACDVERASGQADDVPRPPAPPSHATPWRYTLVLGVEQLKQVDIVPLQLNILSGLGIEQTDCERLFLVLSELYNNALDHGILGLDSSLKGEAGGFERYLATRTARLDTLTEGEIVMTIEHIVFENNRLLRIHLKDSGNGFHYRHYLEEHSVDPSAPFGRGIFLVRRLAADLRYLGSGNEVIVDYTL